MLGDWESGVAQIKAALTIAPDPPGWYYIPIAVDAFRRSDFETSLFNAQRMLALGDSRGLPLAMAAAHRLSRTELASDYLSQFVLQDRASPFNPVRSIRNVLNVPEVLQLYDIALSEMNLISAFDLAGRNPAIFDQAS